MANTVFLHDLSHFSRLLNKVLLLDESEALEKNKRMTNAKGPNFAHRQVKEREAQGWIDFDYKSKWHVRDEANVGIEFLAQVVLIRTFAKVVRTFFTLHNFICRWIKRMEVIDNKGAVRLFQDRIVPL